MDCHSFGGGPDGNQRSRPAWCATFCTGESRYSRTLRVPRWISAFTTPQHSQGQSPINRYDGGNYRYDSVMRANAQEADASIDFLQIVTKNRFCAATLPLHRCVGLDGGTLIGKSSLNEKSPDC